MSIKDNIKKVSCIIPDRMFLQLRYFLQFKKLLNLRNPKTYNEKLQWLKLYDRNPEYNRMVDKYEAKKYVAERVGEQYIIPTLGVWEHFDEIDFDSLPDKFVLKCTHDSGGLVICKDKSMLDWSATGKTLETCLQHNYFWDYREWPYKDVKPRIIAEAYMENDGSGELNDYKFFAFDGDVKAVLIVTDRQSTQAEPGYDFFDMDFQHLDFTLGHPNAKNRPSKPSSFEEMKQLASVLSKGFPQLRVDFYEVNGKVYFGELTFFHGSGLRKFDPVHWDERMGSWIKLPERK